MHFEEGRHAPAISDILAGMALSRNVSVGGSLILLLVGYNIEHRMGETLALCLPKLRAEEIQDLKKRLAALPTGGNAASAMQVAEKFDLDWLIRKVKDTKDNDKLLAQLSPLFMREGPGRSTHQEQLAKAREFIQACGDTGDGMVRFAEKVRPSYAFMAAKLELPPDEFEKVFQLEEKKQADNPVFPVIFPSLRKIRLQQARTDVRRSLLLAALAVQLDGPGAQKNHPDPVIGEPFEYVAFEGGFHLRSKLKGQDNQPLSITIDRRGK
jgi:hypothetical protein